MPDQLLTPGPHRVVSEDALRRWKRRRRRLRRRLRWARDGLIVVLAVSAVYFAVHERGASGKAAVTSTTVPHKALGRAALDVKLHSCDFETNAAVAHITITNHGAVRENYVVNVAFADGPQLFSAGEAAVNFLQPGAHVERDAAGVTSRLPPTKLECWITRVQRFQ
jgi:hypothetical protein